MDATNTRDCQHGQLARSCDRCADAAEIAELRAEVERLKEHAVVLANTERAVERIHCADYLMRTANECPADSPVRATLEACAGVLRLGLVEWA